MATFASYDGTELSYHELGTGDPLICLPGGPLQPSAYLDDLGGLPSARRLILLDHRGTGASAVPQDPESYRVDRMVADVDALRLHLGLGKLDILAHSAGANLAVLYAAAHPDRVSSLILITPSTRAVGFEPSMEALRARLLTRRDEPWFPAAWEAFQRIEAGDDSDETWELVAPVYYGAWTPAAQAHHGLMPADDEKQAVHHSKGVFTPEATKAAIAGLEIPVLVLAGERDPGPTPERAQDFARMFPKARVRFEVQAGAGHFPWVDDPATFGALVAGWLAGDA
jgi:pimeloyl-ACP methyl ester carboxylesterase